MDSSRSYRSPAIQLPTLETLRNSADVLHMELSDDQLKQFQGEMKILTELFTDVDNLQEPTLPVKYPRTCGYRPSPEENTLNAWYWKCDIKGATGGVLDGKKVAIKDNVAVAGVPMMNGSHILEGYMPEFDATVVTRILDEGGNILGKAACEDFCFCGGNSWTNVKGPTRNPVDECRMAGGSSSGSAALVATGEVDMAIGGDQGGSVRIPASWCGIVGLKPTFGLVPYTGAMSIEPTHDHLGPMARSVKDVAVLLEVIAGIDGFDHRQPTVLENIRYSEHLTGDIEGMKIGFLKEGFDKCSENVVRIVSATQTCLEDMKAIVEWTSVSTHSSVRPLFLSALYMGILNSMVAGEGHGTGTKGFYPTSMCEYLRRGYAAAGNQIGKNCQSMLLFTHYMKENYGNKFYNKSMNLCPVVTRAYNDQLDKFDVVVMPTVPYTARRIPTADLVFDGPPKECEVLTYNTAPFNYTGHPAVTINAGFSDGLPVGVMIVGKHFDECTVLKVAHALEQKLKMKN